MVSRVYRVYAVRYACRATNSLKAPEATQFNEPTAGRPHHHDEAGYGHADDPRFAH